MAGLTELKCVPCRGGEPPLTQAEIAELQPHVPDWRVFEKDCIPRLERTFKLKNFAQALAFTNRVGEIAEADDQT